MVSLANNHLNDFGSKGANFTVKVLKEAGLKYFGVSYGKFSSSQVRRSDSYKRCSHLYLLFSFLPTFLFFFLFFFIFFFTNEAPLYTGLLFSFCLLFLFYFRLHLFLPANFVFPNPKPSPARVKCRISQTGKANG